MLDMLPRTPTDVTPAEAAALLAIARAPMAISNRAGLAWCSESLDRLIAAGYVVEWTPARTKERLVTFSPWAAEALKVDLYEIGPDERPAWEADRREEEPNRKRPVRLPPQAVRRRLPRPELIPCPSGEPVFAWSTPVSHRALMDRIKKKVLASRKSKKHRRNGRKSVAT